MLYMFSFFRKTSLFAINNTSEKLLVKQDR